jgi:hypothetical protein
MERCRVKNVAQYGGKLQAICGPGSVVGVATGCGLDGSGDRIPVGGEIFRTCPDRPWGPPSLVYNKYLVFPGGKKRPGRNADPSPPSSAVVMKE